MKVWQAVNFLIKRLNLCLRGEAMIQMGVSVLHRKRALLQRQMYYKNIIKMLLHVRAVKTLFRGKVNV